MLRFKRYFVPKANLLKQCGAFRLLYFLFWPNHRFSICFCPKLCVVRNAFNRPRSAEGDVDDGSFPKLEWKFEDCQLSKTRREQSWIQALMVRCVYHVSSDDTGDGSCLVWGLSCRPAWCMHDDGWSTTLLQLLPSRQIGIVQKNHTMGACFMISHLSASQSAATSLILWLKLDADNEQSSPQVIEASSEFSCITNNHVLFMGRTSHNWWLDSPMWENLDVSPVHNRIRNVMRWNCRRQPGCFHTFLIFPHGCWMES